MNKPKHVIGISGGKDSAALAIYLRDNYPQLNLIYYFCDTGKELDETYQLIDRLEGYLGSEITKLKAEESRDDTAHSRDPHECPMLSMSGLPSYSGPRAATNQGIARA